MGFFKRLLGICATSPPGDPTCWQVAGTNVEVDLARAPELASPGGAIRLEGGDMPQRVLIVHGDDGRFYAVRNKCTHAGRRIDPVAGTQTLQCCSLGKSTFDYTGRRVSGFAKKPLTLFQAELVEGKLVVSLA